MLSLRTSKPYHSGYSKEWRLLFICEHLRHLRIGVAVSFPHITHRCNKSEFLWNANMDITGLDPFFNLYGTMWPIRTLQRQFPPAKFVFNQSDPRNPRIGTAVDSLVSQGCIISGATVRSSVLSYNETVRGWAEADESVIMNSVEVGRHCRIKKAIIDKHNVIPAPIPRLESIPRRTRKDSRSRPEE